MRDLFAVLCSLSIVLSHRISNEDRAGLTAGTNAVPDSELSGEDLLEKERFEDDFEEGTQSDAAITCRQRLASGDCDCSDGTVGGGCCSDGNVNDTGHGGGWPAGDADEYFRKEGISWRWNQRPDTDWQCTKENHCLDHGVWTGTRGADIVFVKKGVTCQTPRVLYVHGGSWGYGAPNGTGYFETGMRLARMTGAIVMSIDYPFPGVCIDKGCKEHWNAYHVRDRVLRALEYLQTTVPAMPEFLPEGCEQSPASALIIGGDSAGAGTAYSLMLSLANGVVTPRTPFKLSGGFFWSGFYDLQCKSSSYTMNFGTSVARHHHPNSTWLLGSNDRTDSPTPADYAWNSCRVTARRYAGSWAATSDPYLSTAMASKSMLQKLPPSLFHVAAAYALEGENFVVAQNQAAADPSNQVYLDVYDGMVHDLQMYSEGCGSGVKLWHGERAWQRAARFIIDVAATGDAPCLASMPKGSPLTTWHMTKPPVPHGSEGGPWTLLKNDGFPCDAAFRTGFAQTIATFVKSALGHRQAVNWY